MRQSTTRTQVFEPPPRWTADDDHIRLAITQQPDLTLAELQAWLDLAYSLRAAEQDRPDVAAQRRAWRDRQPAFEPRRLEFVDATWVRNLAFRSRFACTWASTDHSFRFNRGPLVLPSESLTGCAGLLRQPGSGFALCQRP